MQVAWEIEDNGKVHASVGPYDLDIDPPHWPNQDSYQWTVMIGDMIGDEGESPTQKEAQAAALGYVRAEVAELALSFGLIEEGWIKPEDRMPPEDHEVLVWVNYGQIFGPQFPACQDATESSWNGNRWELGSAYNPKVLYWREKPKPPAGFTEYPGCECDSCQPDQESMLIQPDEGA